jgi:predicted nucleic acid-binding protein
MYLLDTNVISELRRPRPHRAVMEWIERVDERTIFLSAVTMAEIQSGIEITREQDPDKARELQAWADMIMQTRTVLPMDGETFRLWARLMHRKPDRLYEDAMIAATARQHGLSVVTRNVKDFGGFDVEIVNPFAEA